MNTPPSIDPVWLERVVRLVIDRLKQASDVSASPNDLVIREKVINEATILKQPANSTVMISANSLVTPLARDAARDRNVKIKRTGESCK